MDHSLAVTGLETPGEVFRVLDFTRRILEADDAEPDLAALSAIFVGRDAVDCSFRISIRLSCALDPARTCSLALSSCESERLIVLLSADAGIERFRGGALVSSQSLPAVLLEKVVNESGGGCVDIETIRIAPADLANLTGASLDRLLAFA